MPGALVSAGERVALRTAESEDVSFRQRSLANPALRHPIGNLVVARGELEGDPTGGDTDLFVVCREDDPVPGDPGEDVERIGAVAVSGGDRCRPELGYWIAPEYHGEGYGTAAVSLTVDYAFRTYDHPAVEATVLDFNEASIGLLESLGFEREGRLRDRCFIDGAYRDHLWFGLRREDWDGWRRGD